MNWAFTSPSIRQWFSCRNGIPGRRGIHWRADSLEGHPSFLTRAPSDAASALNCLASSTWVPLILFPASHLLLQTKGPSHLCSSPHLAGNPNPELPEQQRAGSKLGEEVYKVRWWVLWFLSSRHRLFQNCVLRNCCPNPGAGETVIMSAFTKCPETTFKSKQSRSQRGHWGWRDFLRG